MCPEPAAKLFGSGSGPLFLRSMRHPRQSPAPTRDTLCTRPNVGEIYQMERPCWTCRNRTIQCDKSQVPCFKCEKAGLECFEQRPLRWVSGVAIRGKLRGHVFGKDAERIEGQKRTRPKGNKAISRRLAINSSPSLALQDPRISNLDASSKFYLDYYCKRICKLYILYDSDRNPFRNLLAYTEENSPLQKSILALAARHFANTGHSFNQISTDLHPRFDQGHLDALLFKKQAIEGLSSSLSRIDMHEKDSLTAAILLLIFLDILESGIDGWKSHLRGVKSLVSLYWTLKSPVSSGTIHKDPGDTVQETRRFIATQFSLIETLGAAMSSTESMPEHAFGEEIPRQQESILRSFLGCPGFLLRAIQFFSNQRESIARLRTLDDISYNEHIRDTIAMLQLTTDFDSYEWACDFQRPSGSSATETEKAFLLSETYKVATLLYGKRVLGFIQATTPDTEVLVSQLLGMINDLKRDMNFFKCLLWPTFIVGLNCREPNQQHLVIETLAMIWDLTSCLNVISASKILREHWQRESQSDSPLQANSYIGGLGGDWLLI